MELAIYVLTAVQLQGVVKQSKKAYQKGLKFESLFLDAHRGHKRNLWISLVT